MPSLSLHLRGGGKKDLSTRIFRKKKEIYSQAPITFVGCSRWLAEKAKVSGLLTGQTVINIPNAINTNLYKPHNKQEARRKCRLPQEGKLILFGSVKITDKRKGIDYLIEACKAVGREASGMERLTGRSRFRQSVSATARA